jgi:thioredoxin 1
MADINFTDQNFQQDVLQSNQPVVIDFWAPWCGPCRVVSPIIEELAKEYDGKVKVGKMNVDENPQIAGQFGIMSIPTVMMFRNGQPVQSMVGAKSKDTYKRTIDEVLGSA